MAPGRTPHSGGKTAHRESDGQSHTVAARRVLPRNGCRSLYLRTWQTTLVSEAGDGDVFLGSNLVIITSARRSCVEQQFAAIYFWQTFIENLGYDFRSHVSGWLIVGDDRARRLHHHLTNGLIRVVGNYQRDTGTNNESLNVGITVTGVEVGGSQFDGRHVLLKSVRRPAYSIL